MSERVTVAVRVRPGASRDAVGGTWEGPDGSRLLVTVRARAVDGVATKAVVSVVAEALEVPRQDVRLLRGATSRSKLLAVESDDVPALEARLARLLRGVGDPPLSSG